MESGILARDQHTTSQPSEPTQQDSLRGPGRFGTQRPDEAVREAWVWTGAAAYEDRQEVTGQVAASVEPALIDNHPKKTSSCSQSRPLCSTPCLCTNSHGISARVFLFLFS